MCLEFDNKKLNNTLEMCKASKAVKISWTDSPLWIIVISLSACIPNSLAGYLREAGTGEIIHRPIWNIQFYQGTSS